MPLELTNSQTYLVALAAGTGEHAVRAFARGEKVPTKIAAKILHAMLEHGLDVSDLPPFASRPVVCSGPTGERTANGRISRADLGLTFAERRDRR